MSDPDFTSRHMGTIVLLWPQSDAATEWVADNLPDEYGARVVTIEYGCFYDIACGLLSHGLTMRDDASGRMAALPEAA